MFPVHSTVPAVVGLPRGDAERLVKAARLFLSVVEHSHSSEIVMAQDPSAGELVPFGEGMTIWLGVDQGPDSADREPTRPLPNPIALSGGVDPE
jgi:hypothetical protein